MKNTNHAAEEKEMKLVIEVTGTNRVEVLEEFYYQLCLRMDNIGLTFNHKIVKDIK